MELIKDEEQWFDLKKVRYIENYQGICDACGTPVEYKEPFLIVLAKETELIDYLVPLVNFRCPECKNPVKLLRILKNMDITAELNALKNVEP